MLIKEDSILREIIWLRLSQIYVNELYKDGKFKISLSMEDIDKIDEEIKNI